MLTAIEFYDQATFRAVKVNNEVPNEVLPSKLGAAKPPMTQLRPQPALRFCLIIA